MEHRSELNEYIDAVLNRKASDLHLSTGKKPYFRIERKLIQFVQKEDLTEEDTRVLLKILTEGKFDSVEKEMAENKQILFSYRHTSEGKEINFRGAAYTNRGKTSIALRLVPNADVTLEELNLPSILGSVIAEPQGLFLIVGPAGHGKSTTLAAMIQHINSIKRRNIITIEDPIEFLFKDNMCSIMQREVPSDAYSFQAAMNHALRADIDILMVGEMRETETMRTVMTAAEIGHLVLSTIHSNSASQTVNRIIDSFPANQQPQIRNQLSLSLLGILSIRLLPTINGGLVPACEILLNNNAVANLIREGKIQSIDTVIQTSRGEGMVSIDQAIAELVKEGKVTLETARIHSSDEKELNRYL